MSDIAKANEARKQLLVQYPRVITSASLRLTDAGFVIDITWDRAYKWQPITEFMGFKVNAERP